MKNQKVTRILNLSRALVMVSLSFLSLEAFGQDVVAVPNPQPVNKLLYPFTLPSWSSLGTGPNKICGVNSFYAPQPTSATQYTLVLETKNDAMENYALIFGRGGDLLIVGEPVNPDDPVNLVQTIFSPRNFKTDYTPADDQVAHLEMHTDSNMGIWIGASAQNNAKDTYIWSTNTRYPFAQFPDMRVENTCLSIRDQNGMVTLQNIGSPVVFSDTSGRGYSLISPGEYSMMWTSYYDRAQLAPAKITFSSNQSLNSMTDAQLASSMYAASAAAISTTASAWDFTAVALSCNTKSNGTAAMWLPLSSCTSGIPVPSPTWTAPAQLIRDITCGHAFKCMTPQLEECIAPYIANGCGNNLGF